VAFHGYYTTNLSGVNKGLMTTGQPSLQFPPRISYDDKEWQLARTYQVDTPNQVKQLKEYCQKNHIEQDITY
jgi:hypothetical protein